jgi:hypothetical protein
MKRSKSIEKARANLVSDMSMWQYSRDTNSKSVNWKKLLFLLTKFVFTYKCIETYSSMNKE